MRTSVACPAGEGAVAIADLANSQPGRLPNAGGLELWTANAEGQPTMKGTATW